MIIDNVIFENKIEENMIDILHSLNKEELDEVISTLDLSNNEVVILKNKN